MTQEDETEEVPCTCDGYNPNCSHCFGTGYISRHKRPLRPVETEAMRLAREAEGRRKYEESQHELHQRCLEEQKKREEQQRQQEETNRERSEEEWKRERKLLWYNLAAYVLLFLFVIVLVHSYR
jgi:Flp pilus assembly protein TadB